MGSDFCTCLSDLTGGESEDLSIKGNDKDNIKREVKKPKVVLHKQGSLDSSDPLQSQKDNSISTNINSDYRNTLNHQQKQLKKNLQSKKYSSNNTSKSNKSNTNNNKINNIENNNIEYNSIDNNIENNNKIEDNIKNENKNKKENKNKVDNNNIINNNKKEYNNILNNNNVNKNIKGNVKNEVKNKEKEKLKEEEKKKEEEIIDFDKELNRENMVSENFNKFFNSQKGQEMILDMEDPKKKICISLHKYFVSLITRREYKKKLKYFKKESEVLFQNCLNLIHKSNPYLKKLENSNYIKYTPDGFLKYYPNPKDSEKMKFDPKKESFDNCIIIHYEEDDDTSSIDKMIWIFKGQVNKQGDPHGFGEKFYKNGLKEKGYWKEGELYGWCMKIDSNNKNIFVGPFYGNKGITGLGEKFTLKKKVLYKGEFIDGEKSGKGEEDSSEGKFVGNFYHDKKNGKGKMIFKNSGDIYEGDYKNDLFDGEGHYIWKMTGQEYTGEYKNGLMHGKGLYEWNEGEFYRGNFVNGKKEGEGELHMGNGRVYIGPFVNGRPNGIGIYDNGINFRGEMEFIDGKMNINYLKRNYTNSSINTINVTENNNDNNGKEDNG